MRFTCKDRIHVKPILCEIDVKDNVVVCTEIPENYGRNSITNAAEDIATAVCQRFDIPMEDIIWIEHDTPESYCETDREESWDVVTFEIEKHQYTEPKRRFEHPQWMRIPASLADALINSETIRPYAEELLTQIRDNKPSALLQAIEEIYQKKSQVEQI